MWTRLAVALFCLAIIAAAQAQSVEISGRNNVGYTRLANGFDFPVGKPDAGGYYKARGYTANYHLGEDWDGVRGGDSDLGDPVSCIGEGVVVFAHDVHRGWGNVIIVRHSYREEGEIKTIDSLYGHLDKMLVRAGDTVRRGQKIGTMGTAHGIYDAHLHFEIRKNLEIGMSRAAFAQDLSNYYDPTKFIQSHRQLTATNALFAVAVNTFKRDATINFDLAKNYSSHRGSSGEDQGSGSSSTRDSATLAKNAVTFERVTPLED
jgi:murein DD-endopeptidase MepM/ murein hydrolase activator NlpD